MKKILLILSISFISITVILVFCTIFLINNNISKNKNVKDYINNLNLTYNDNEIYNYYPRIEIYKKNYIGMLINDTLSIELPIEAKCDRFIQSSCLFNENKLVILATNLIDSIPNYSEIDIDQEFTFNNFWDSKNVYKVEKIIHTNNIKNISQYDSNFVLIIKDYYKMEYIIYICN